MLTISFHATKKIEVFLTAKNNATQEKTVLLQLKKTENSPNIPFSIFFPQFLVSLLGGFDLFDSTGIDIDC